MRLEGKVALVTGGSSGIGRASALAFAGEGARVIIADVNVEGGEETVGMIKEAGGEAMFVEANVSKAADVAALVDRAVDGVFGGGGLQEFHYGLVGGERSTGSLGLYGNTFRDAQSWACYIGCWGRLHSYRRCGGPCVPRRVGGAEFHRCRSTREVEGCVVGHDHERLF